MPSGSHATLSHAQRNETVVRRGGPPVSRTPAAPRGAHRVTSKRAGQRRLTGEDCFGPFGRAMTDGVAPLRRTAPRRPDGWGRASPASASSPSHATKSPLQRNETFVRHAAHPAPATPTAVHARQPPARPLLRRRLASSLARMIEASRFPLAHPAFPSDCHRDE
jgi:hypothetical protein